MDVDAVEERPGQFVRVPADVLEGTAADAAVLSVRDAVVAAGTGVHGPDELDVPGVRDRGPVASDGDAPVFERLAQRFEDRAREVGRLVKEEDAIVGEGDFAGRCLGAPARHGGEGGRVVRRPEGTLDHEGQVLRQEAAHGVDVCGLERLVVGHLGQDAREAFREHALAGAGRADQQDVVAAGRGDLQGAARLPLPDDFGEVRGVGAGVFLHQDVEGHRLHGLDELLAPQVREKFLHRVDRINVHRVADGGRFLRVPGRDEGLLHPLLPGADEHGEHATDPAHIAPEGQFAKEHRGRQLVELALEGLLSGDDLVVGEHHGREDGQVVDGSLLAEVRRGQVHGDAADGELEPAVSHRGAHPFLRLRHRRIWQADEVEPGQAARQVHFDRHELRGQTAHPGAFYTCVHKNVSFLTYPAGRRIWGRRQGRLLPQGS